MVRIVSKTLLIDFDGTIVEHEFPQIGAPLHGAFKTLIDLKAAGYKLVLWTCRDDSHRDTPLTDAIEFCKQNGVRFDGVNQTLPCDEFRDEYMPRAKPHAMLCIDDRNLGGFPGWHVVREMFGLTPLDTEAEA